MRFFSTLLFLGLVLSACGSATPTFVPLSLPPSSGVGGSGAGQVAPFPPPTGGGGGGGGGGTAPAVVFDDSAIGLGRAGAYPSDLAVNGSGTLFTVDDALVPCKVLGFHSDGTTTPTMGVSIGASHLIDMDGKSPARSVTAFGSGLFGAFTGDIAVAFGRWLFVTVGAGNSASDDGSNPLRLANLLVVDTHTASVVQTVNLAWNRSGAGTHANGGSYDAIPQSLPVNAIFLPDGNGTLTGRVFVALSNGLGDSAGLKDYYQGTVQQYRVDFALSQPLSRETTGKAAEDHTRTYVSSHYNPVGLSGYVAATGRSFLILTSAGASTFDANFVAHPTTSAYLEFLDLKGGGWKPGWEIDLGKILPAPSTLAHGTDDNGLHYALLASQTFAAAYLVELTGLEREPVDPLELRLVRTVELAAGGAVTAGSGFQPGIAMAPSGRSAVVSSFSANGLQLIGLPGDVEFGQISVDPAPFATANLGSAKGFGLGAVVIPPGASAEAYVIVNGTFGPNWMPALPACIGTLSVSDGLP